MYWKHQMKPWSCWQPAPSNYRPSIGTPDDYDGDGITDVAVYRPTTAVWYMTSNAHFTTWSTYQWGSMEMFRSSRSGKAEVADPCEVVEDDSRATLGLGPVLDHNGDRSTIDDATAMIGHVVTPS